MARLLESRSARLYNAPARPARPFKADYPKGARTDGTGRLTHDIEGRPLQDGSRIVGRRGAGGTDEALSPKEFDAIATEATGGPAEKVAIPGNDMGRVAVHPVTRRPTDIALSKDIPANKQLLVYGHEIGHVIDQLAGEIETKGLSRELERFRVILTHTHQR